MANAKGEVRGAGCIFLEARPVCLAVGFAVAIANNGTVCPVNNRHMHGAIHSLGFTGACEGLGACEPIAACHPAFRFAFAKDDRVKNDTLIVLKRDCTSATLIQVLEFHPHLQGLLGHAKRQRLGGGKSSAIKHQTFCSLLSRPF